MALTCPHGLPPSECLICPTLPEAVARAPRHPDTRPRPSGGQLALVIGAVALVGLAVWALVGVVLSALHVIELLAVAGAAGWLGYRVGLHRGRRSTPPEG